MCVLVFHAGCVAMRSCGDSSAAPDHARKSPFLWAVLQHQGMVSGCSSVMKEVPIALQ
jgi:hypothetical protein